MATNNASDSLSGMHPVVKTLGEGLDPRLLDESAGLDRLRDILVGNYVRESDRRLARCEQRLGEELVAVRQEMGQRLDALEQHFNDELQALNDLHKVEQTQRQGLQRLNEDHLDKAKATMSAETERLSHALSKAEQDQRKAQHELAKQLRTDIQRVRQELTNRVESERHTLDGGKLDRSLLASMLAELIVRLNGPEDNAASSH